MKRLPPPLEVMHLAFEGALPPVSRADDPATSKSGERRIAPKRGTQASQLLAMFRAYPRGLTAKEAALYAHIEHGWKRVSDLKNAGWIVGTGEVRDACEVYVAVDAS